MSQNKDLPSTMAAARSVTKSPRFGGSGTGTVLNAPNAAGAGAAAGAAAAPLPGPEAAFVLLSTGGITASAATAAMAMPFPRAHRHRAMRKRSIELDISVRPFIRWCCDGPRDFSINPQNGTRSNSGATLPNEAQMPRRSWPEGFALLTFKQAKCPNPTELVSVARGLLHYVTRHFRCKRS